jgi:hypothetical protein
VGVEVIRDAEGADESIESLTETADGKVSAVRLTDEEFHRFSGFGIDGGRSATALFPNEPDELGRLFVNRDDPFVVELSQWDADGIALSGFPDQALTVQARQLARS